MGNESVPPIKTTPDHTPPGTAPAAARAGNECGPVQHPRAANGHNKNNNATQTNQSPTKSTNQPLNQPTTHQNREEYLVTQHNQPQTRSTTNQTNKINEGLNEQQIYDLLKEKYGEWILYDPGLNKNTYLLWLLPILIFVFGGAIIPILIFVFGGAIIFKRSIFKNN